MKGPTFLELLMVTLGLFSTLQKQTFESFLQPWYLVVTSEKFERLNIKNLSLPKLPPGR